ncbi:hypothetical protein GOP47_0004064 [Adiantum capillus-veneris]|uniref:Histone chaperone domain-containing protein n=1 Tax=Adiantum capillus-veneris TaxID=13818 RepID=A0A9D4V6T5_ADICA|nr:hypothetical protein GOP47_0004064 [Adiantum capillus-veneris]
MHHKPQTGWAAETSSNALGHESTFQLAKFEFPSIVLTYFSRRELLSLEAHDAKAVKGQVRPEFCPVSSTMAEELPSSEEGVHALLQSAVSSRASHIRKEAETITMANVRRLLESDLGLEKSALDVHKVFIRQLVDEVLLSSENAEGQEEEATVSEEAPKRKKKSSGKKVTEGKRSHGQTEDDYEDPQENNHVEAPKKKKQKKEKVKKEQSHSKEEDEDGGGSQVELSEEGANQEAPKAKGQKSKAERDEEITEAGEDGGGSQSEMSEESDISAKKSKAASKTTSVKPVQNRKIEHLKKIIKACGLTIPPQIYKRVKQQPEEKHDKFLIKELEDILSRNGLSSDPSEKEIKAAKRKIAREKDMEGIDTTNIILEPRGRRATSQLFAPVYNPPPVEYDSEQDEDGEGGDEEGSDNASEGSDDEKDFAAADETLDSPLQTWEGSQQVHAWSSKFFTTRVSFLLKVPCIGRDHREALSFSGGEVLGSAGRWHKQLESQLG